MQYPFMQAYNFKLLRLLITLKNLACARFLYIFKGYSPIQFGMMPINNLSNKITTINTIQETI